MVTRAALLLVSLAVLACGPTRPSDDDGDDGDDGDDAPDVDNDGDGYPASSDCNDDNAAINPGVAEACEDGVDNDCDGGLDHGDYECMTPCERAAFDRSSVGCVFYGVDTNYSLGGPYAIAVSNVDPATPANVVVEIKSGGTWTQAAPPAVIGPRSLVTFNVPRLGVPGSQIAVGAAYRVTSDLPVIAYQFAPIDGSASFLSDASLLLSAASLDTVYLVPAWPQGASDDCTRTTIGDPAHIQIAGTADNTMVTVTSPTTSQGGTGVPPLQPGVAQTFVIGEGDLLQLTIASFNTSFDGMYIQATAPVAVFSSNDCANVPNSCAACCCEHLEEQIFGLQTWGTRYVAAQMPRRAAEPSLWHILAQQDQTTVTFTAGPGVTGVPASISLSARQKVELMVAGGAFGGDFLVESDKPVHVNQYTVGSNFAGVPGIGDPDMVQAIPVEQYLQSYVVLVPGTWNNDYLVLVRPSGSAISVDGMQVTTGWQEVAGGYESARVPVADGVHVIDGSMPFGVSVSGYDTYDSYSYPGGLDQRVINPVE